MLITMLKTIDKKQAMIDYHFSVHMLQTFIIAFHRPL